LASKESYEPEPRKPRLIWSGRDKRKVSEPVPSQVIEVIFPQYAEVKDLRSWKELRRTQAQQARLPELRTASQTLLGNGDGDGLLRVNRLIWTNDNLVALTSLLHGDNQHAPLAGKVDLIYIDPPFAVQNDFRINVQIQNGAADEKLPTLIEEIAYTDTWHEGLDSYLWMMRDRLELLKQLLAPTGSIYVHCDWHAGHYIKILMDEVFGYDQFKNEVIWKRSLPHNDPKKYGAIHDSIFLYTKSDLYTFNQQFTEQSDEYKRSHYTQRDPDGRIYRLQSLSASGPGPARTFGERVIAPPAGTHWRYSQEKIDQLLAQGLIVFTSTGQPNYKRYLDESKGSALQSIWTDVNPLNAQALERMDFPTQKPLALLQRIIAASSNTGDLILDAFAGSGTTAVAAEIMKDVDGKPAPRRWIAIDCGKFAVHITRKRLIEAGAHPFAVENIGFYASGREWHDLWALRPQAKVYRDAMVELYGGRRWTDSPTSMGARGTAGSTSDRSTHPSRQARSRSSSAKPPGLI
jgi:DNA modification methylase